MKSLSDRAKPVPDDDLALLAMMVAKLAREARIAGPRHGRYRVLSEDPDAVGRPQTMLSVDLNLGRGLIVHISLDWDEHDRTAARMFEKAAEIVEALSIVRSDETKIRSTMSEIKTAAKREIAKANRLGLEYRFASAKVAPSQPGQDQGICVELSYHGVSRNLRRQLLEAKVHTVEDVVDEFIRRQQSQLDRINARNAFNEVGASGKIDAVVLGALRQAGIDDAQLLASLAEREECHVDLQSDDGRRFRLLWENGSVFAEVSIAAGLKWMAGSLHFDCAQRDLGPSLEGEPASSVFANPLLGPDIRIVSSHGKKGEKGWMSCTRPMVDFNLETGRLAA